MKSFYKYLFFFVFCNSIFSQEIVRVPIDTFSTPLESEVKLTLFLRFQHYNPSPAHPNDLYEVNINSPKSAIFLNDKSKLYINSLEGFTTVVYDVEEFKYMNRINHRFQANDSLLFNNQFTVFDYEYVYRKENQNIFSGKPVESCLSHDGKYLWVTYYRRSFDLNAISPSAVAIIDTETDRIVRVMPTGPLPKMIAASPDSKYVAVTHWGDNTIGIIDVSSDSVFEFKYVKQFVVGRKPNLDFSKDEKVDRDNDCGYCLRGTVFTPDSKYLLVCRMGGGGIAVFDMDQMKYLGTVFGMKSNLRHIVIENNEIFISSNLTGFVQKTNLESFLENKLEKGSQNSRYSDWQSCYIGGIGARTICITSNAKYIFATVNNSSKIAVIRSEDMKVVSTILCDSYPVGMAISPDDSVLVVTSQGKKGEGGNSVMLFKIEYLN